MDINRMTNKLIAAIASLILKELWTPRAVIIVTSIVSATVITFMFGARRIRLGKARCASRQLNVADLAAASNQLHLGLGWLLQLDPIKMDHPSRTYTGAEDYVSTSRTLQPHQE